MSNEEPGRRDLLRVTAAFVAITIGVFALSLAVRARRERVGSVERASVEAFLGPLAEGAPFEGHRIAHVDGLRAGALRLAIITVEGERFLVDVRARSATAPPGVADTDRLALYVLAERPGPTPEPIARACVALALALRARQDAAPLPAFTPLTGL